MGLFDIKNYLKYERVVKPFPPLPPSWYDKDIVLSSTDFGFNKFSQRSKWCLRKFYNGVKMILTQNMIFNIILLIARIIGLSGILPQIVLNYKAKSTKGLSNIFLFIYLVGSSINLLYIYGLDLPIAYKIMAPLAFLLVLTLVFQYFFYNKHKVAFRLIISYCVFFLLFFLLIILAVNFPNKIGNLAGWICFLIWFVYLLPQIFRIYSKKSVKGFSFLFVFLGIIGNLLELVGILALRLPIQSILIAIRGFSFCSIFCLQFWMYRKK